ncbi:MAG: ATP-binding cassette domain-containing protein [Rhizobiales bacterium]|nr:ATP-binding cassette domain-containing protein [Hyphomicrobiales bacterium]
MAARIRVENLIKRYGAATAVDGVSFEVGEGELVALLGPSGCGKTTTLRCIGGYETPTSGTIEIAGRSVTELPIHKRDIGMVFQSYALFPHKSVEDNVGFALKMRGVPKPERKARTAEALELVDMSGYGTRYPGQLSGGQRQRVALARALIHRPAILLLDEPLANLDRKLRETMRVEIKLIQEKVGISALFVTHDQEEALVMADRIAVMEGGRIHQLGTPGEIYNHPATSFVARFIGETNFLEGRLEGDADGLAGRGLGRIDMGDGVGFVASRRAGAATGDKAAISIRPERIEIGERAPAGAANVSAGEVVFVTYLGSSVSYRVRTRANLVLHVSKPLTSEHPTFEAGSRVETWWPPERGSIIA